MTRWKDIIGFRAFKRPEYPKMDMTDLDRNQKELSERVDRLREALLNGEDEWFLCLTRKKEACDDTG